jgi:hypothetical protein
VGSVFLPSEAYIQAGVSSSGVSIVCSTLKHSLSALRDPYRSLKSRDPPELGPLLVDSAQNSGQISYFSVFL